MSTSVFVDTQIINALRFFCNIFLKIPNVGANRQVYATILHMDTKKGIPLRKCRIVTNYTHAVSAFFAVVQTPSLKNTKSVISETNLFPVLFDLTKLIALYKILLYVLVFSHQIVFRNR